MFFSLILILKILLIIVPLLLSVAYFTLAERKIMASIQRRRGPNVIGYLGLLQPLADGLKLFIKETILPTSANIFIFLLAPLLTFFLSLMGWVVIPFGENLMHSNHGFLINAHFIFFIKNDRNFVLNRFFFLLLGRTKKS